MQMDGSLNNFPTNLDFNFKGRRWLYHGGKGEQEVEEERRGERFILWDQVRMRKGVISTNFYAGAAEWSY